MPKRVAVKLIAPIVDTVLMFLFVAVRRDVFVGNGVFITIIIHIHNGGTITRNGLLLYGMGFGEVVVLIVFKFRGRTAGQDSGICLFAGCSGFGFRYHIGIVIVISVLCPVDDRILRAVAGRPVCRQVCSCVNSSHLSIFLIPAVEVIAHSDRNFVRADIDCGASLEKLRRHVFAAVDIIGNPVAFLNVRSQGNAAGGIIHLCRRFAIEQPVDDSLSRVKGVRSQRFGFCKMLSVYLRFSVVRALSGIANRIVFVHEEHIARRIVLGGDFIGFAGCRRQFGQVQLRAAFKFPVAEIKLFLFRCCRQLQGFAILDDLRPFVSYVSLCIAELICIVLCVIWFFQHIGCHTGKSDASAYILCGFLCKCRNRQHRQDHDKCHKGGDQFFHWSHHNALPPIYLLLSQKRFPAGGLYRQPRRDRMIPYHCFTPVMVTSTFHR